MSILASASESVRAIRFRSSPRLPEVFLLPPAHPSAVSVESDARHAVLMALSHFPIVQQRDLQRRLTKRCSPHLLMPWLPRSSESVPPRGQHGQERSKRRFAKNGQRHDTNCTNYYESRRPHSWRIKLVTDKSGAGRVVDGWQQQKSGVKPPHSKARLCAQNLRANSRNPCFTSIPLLWRCRLW